MNIEPNKSFYEIYTTCKGISRDGNQCPYNPFENGFCGRHQSLFECQEIFKSGYDCCYKCRKKINIKIDVNTINWRDFCMNKGSRCDNCRSKVRDIYHKKQESISIINSELITLNKKVCKNCKVEKSIEEFKNIKTNKNDSERCRTCLDKFIIYDRKNRLDNKSMCIEANGMLTDSNELYCLNCYNLYPKSDFFIIKTGDSDSGDVNQSHCLTCRERNKVSCHKRNMTPQRKEYLAELEKTDKMILTRKNYRINNREKLLEANKKWRQHQHDNNLEEYLKKQADRMRKYRANNPDVFINERNRFKRNSEYRMEVYKRRALNFNIPFELNYEQCNKYFNDTCFYCSSESSPEQLMGIDRINNNGPYSMDNCVSACKYCNYLKYILDVDVFYGIVEHILTFNKVIPENVGKLHSELFENSPINHYKKYIMYKNSFNANKLTFEISLYDFLNIIRKDCYICGKKSDKSTLNGIDRFDSSIGYLLNNCKSCCTTCNFMKKNFEYKDFICQLTKIYNVYTLNDYEPDLTMCSKITLPDDETTNELLIDDNLNFDIFDVQGTKVCSDCRCNVDAMLFITNNKEYKTCTNCRKPKLLEQTFKCLGCRTNRTIEYFMNNDKQCKTCSICRTRNNKK